VNAVVAVPADGIGKLFHAHQIGQRDQLSAALRVNLQVIQISRCAQRVTLALDNDIVLLASAVVVDGCDICPPFFCTDMMETYSTVGFPVGWPIPARFSRINSRQSLSRWRGFPAAQAARPVALLYQAARSTGLCRGTALQCCEYHYRADYQVTLPTDRGATAATNACPLNRSGLRCY
jgi:hypothetical protein